MKLIFSARYLVLFLLVLVVHPDAFSQTAELKPDQCLAGTPDSPIRIEVFSDFECAACREFYIQTIRPVLKEYGGLGKVCVVYHEFPLQMHKHARQAAQYAKAAQKLGRQQWIAAIDGLYENQAKWALDGSVDETVFKALGADDFYRLKQVVLLPSIDEAIKGEIAMGEKKEVNSTPTSFVYAFGKEQKVVGGVPYPVMKDFIDKNMK
jgi:protein-disulfide isomerase